MHLAFPKLTSPLNQPNNEKTSSPQQQSIVIIVYSVSVGDALAYWCTVVVSGHARNETTGFPVQI